MSYTELESGYQGLQQNRPEFYVGHACCAKNKSTWFSLGLIDVEDFIETGFLSFIFFFVRIVSFSDLFRTDLFAKCDEIR